jgi:small subunit ribosomal protein S15
MERAEKKEIIAKFARKKWDTGSTEVQIAILSFEIKLLQEHIAEHQHDVDAKRSLLKKVAKRRTLLKYLKTKYLEIYTKVSKKVGVKV